MIIQEPFAEWIADLFRVSGKSVFSEGKISMTPQRKSSALIRRAGEESSSYVLRTGLLAIHGDAKRFAHPGMRAICANNELCVDDFHVIRVA
jgi:hypothetical protein